MHREENTLFHMFVKTYEQYKERKAFIYKVTDNEFEVTYEKLFEDVLVLSRAFKSKKIGKGSKVMFLCDNRYEWMVTDFALISLGAISIPRGCDTPTQELEFILEHSGAEFLIIENEQVYTRHETMLNTLKLKAIFILEAPKVHSLLTNLYSYHDLLKDRTIHADEIEAFCARKALLDEEDIVTLIYTSGTTGIPKGVIISHKNIMYNVEELPPLIALECDDVWVSILPSWHIFERAAEYLSIAKGSCTVYSTIKTFAADLEQYKPTIVATVPRLWESMYTKINTALEKKDPKKAKLFNKLVAISAAYKRADRVLKDELPCFKKRSILFTCKDKTIAFFKRLVLSPFNAIAQKKLALVQEKFGGRLRLAVSGGGALPDFLDTWIDAIGIRIVNAYGMTECAPTIAGRALQCNTFSTLGLPVRGTTLVVVDKEGALVGAGEIGEIWVKGEQVMQGYYHNPEENAKSFSEDGFFKTGDLGKLTIKGELVITGRSKEMIVLASGENVDPSRIESTIAMLPFITDAILVGHTKKGLGALIVPDFEKLKEYIASHFDKVVYNIEQVMEDKQIVAKIKSEMNDLLHQGQGFKPFEKLQNIHFLDQEFKVGEELTNTFKKKRHVIEKKYKEIIDKFIH
ncbi:AMP-binding protein [Sulfurospirillum diekertiae]|uniref:AMP-binding protein n=1 Tax=Sulfurospirillum diekertiae TaxID=1854492 RepID=A0A6G9VNT6_9BACT|nr:AMP-binding protein [Sulfurospirillum diekertiae]QIR75005.1 AMP-binding protein [Sulfurospirillum diekertiae]QIR77669.1 AMP-binding protein [Sulfurospirillum diekertiae]